jgi:protein phosphatase
MNEPKIYSASITDRGLNERRPLNEDSFLADAERGIFAVADGVGGSEAGEVASKTAIEVLDEAFRHQVDGADIEDLMELAVQRANASIHRMSHEHDKLSMMATTIVTLHVKGNVATIGHVGDSRLYRLDREGTLSRETEDHSVVEEEVRAGRMTPEQAANHPSKNVISRAVGADESVEVDLKTMEVEDGTCFMLCSDGITRHIPDNELEGLLIAGDDLAALCEELKRRCYARGAEDNLTAVIVRVGEPLPERQQLRDQRTLSLEHAEGGAAPVASADRMSNHFDVTEDALGSPTRIVVPANTGRAQPAQERAVDNRASGGGGVKRFFIFLLFLAGMAGAFYGGIRYQGQLPFGLTRPQPPATAQLTIIEDPWLKFEKARREVDKAPGQWIDSEVPKELARQKITNALESTEPEFLYLYGRALLLSRRNEEAGNAFEQSVVRAGDNAAYATIRKEATLGLKAAASPSAQDTKRADDRLDQILLKRGGSN